MKSKNKVDLTETAPWSCQGLGGKGNGQRSIKAYKLSVVNSKDFMCNLLIIGNDTASHTCNLLRE